MSGHEKRKHPRHTSNALLRVYTDITNCAYTLQLKDISKGGAFVRTDHVPNIGDIITYVILDKNFKQRFVGNAKVVRVVPEGIDRGFAIELEKELVDEISADLI